MINIVITASSFPDASLERLDAEDLRSRLRIILQKYDVSASYVEAGDYGEDIVRISLYLDNDGQVDEVVDLMHNQPLIANFGIEVANRI